MRACFVFGAMVWTGFQLPAFLRLPFGVRSTTCDNQGLSGAPLRGGRRAAGKGAGGGPRATSIHSDFEPSDSGRARKASVGVRGRWFRRPENPSTRAATRSRPRGSTSSGSPAPPPRTSGTVLRPRPPLSPALFLVVGGRFGLSNSARTFPCSVFVSTVAVSRASAWARSWSKSPRWSRRCRCRDLRPLSGASTVTEWRSAELLAAPWSFGSACLSPLQAGPMFGVARKTSGSTGQWQG